MTLAALGVLLVVPTLPVGAVVGSAPNAPIVATAAVVVGETCPAGGKGIDSSGRRTLCAVGPTGRFWVWSGPIGDRPDPATPGSWASITNDSSGYNATPAPAPVAALYADRSLMSIRVVELINSWRSAKGITPLIVDPRLERLTKFWSERLGRSEFTGGTGSHCPKTLCSLRAYELGYVAFGEVIRPWTPIPAGDLDAERFFIDSPPHYAILTNPRFTHIGFAFHIVTDSTGRPASMVVVGQVGRSR